MTRKPWFSVAALLLCVACLPERITPPCSCVDLDRTVEVVEVLSRLDWRELDEAAVVASWPEANLLPCDGNTSGGLGAYQEALRRCCVTCGTCGGPALTQSPDETGLQSISLMVCRKDGQEALDALKRLVDATISRALDRSFEPGWTLGPERKHAVNSYRFRSHEQTFIVEARVGGDEGRWVGIFDLTRCYAREISERWILEDGTSVRILESEIDTSGETSRLRFSYLTNCLIDDHSCMSDEAQRLWPRLRARAEDQGVTSVSWSTEDCRFASIGRGAHRRSDGEWDVLVSGGLQACFSSTSTPCADFGCRNATKCPPAPRRGFSSMRVAPSRRNCSSDASISSTSKQMWCTPSPFFSRKRATVELAPRG